MINKVILLGNIGKQPELKYTKTGKPCLRFSVATVKSWRDQTGKKSEKVSWHNCDVWGQRAESLKQYLNKGTKVYIEGELNYSQWTDKTGQTKYFTSIVAEDVQMLGNPERETRPTNQDMFEDNSPDALVNVKDEGLKNLNEAGFLEEDLPF